MMYQAYFWLKNFLGKFSREEGQGLVEYALILVLIAIIVIAALTATGESIESVFNSITGELGGTVPTPSQ
jgi:pilus assembly protein Flp/PilA